MKFILLLFCAGMVWFSPLVVHAQSSEPSQFFETKPDLSIPIPDLHFAPASIVEETDEFGNVRKTVDVPYLSQYIGSLYKYLVAVSGIIAVVLMMVGGFEYMMDRPKQGIERITNAMVGLGLTLGTYLILLAVNPDLVALKALRLESVDRIDFIGNLQGSMTTGVTASGADIDTVIADTGEVSGAVETAAAKVGLNAVADNIAAKLGFNSCLWKAQIFMETGWRTDVPGSSCCYGLGAVHATYTMTYLKNRFAEIKSIHSQGCPNCPDLRELDMKDKAAVAAARARVVTWLQTDHEGTLIISGMMRKEAIKGAPNPVAATMAYGMGLGSYNGYVKHAPCKPEVFSEADLIARLLAGASVDSLVNVSCPVPGTWPVANKSTDCPMSVGANGADSPRPRACCVSTEGTCVRPPPTKNASGQSIGRKGVCQDGSRKGQTCFGVAGAEEYARKWLKLAQGCLQ